jgi:hypothetical protein
LASEIQVSRGSLKAKGPENLLRGELFWVPANKSNDSTNTYRKDSRFPYDTGTLYIGRPSLSDSNVYEAPIPIAGERAYKGMVFRGFLTDEENITDERFKFVREGDFFIFNNDAVGGNFKDIDDFVKGDILLITNAEYDISPDLLDNVGEARNVEYLRFNGSGGWAKYTKYSHEEHPDVTNVKMALDELYGTKLEYHGRIEEDYSYGEVMTFQSTAKDKLNAGSLFLVTKDGLSFSGKNIKGEATTWISQKGDFVIWQNDDAEWILIPSGYTDAEEIDFDPTEAIQQQQAVGTFTEDDNEHINSTAALTNVKEALNYLLSHKAMLDSNGKVPLSQLHSTVLGSMQYMGTWNPINDAKGVDNPDFQNEWPSGRVTDEITGDEEGSGTGNASGRGNKAGDYYIVKVNPLVANVKYYDKDSTPVGDVYSRCEEINNGDWIVYQVDPATKEASWQIIDNSDSITALNFFINGTHATGEADYAEETTEVSIVGNPTMAATDKLVLWQQDNKINIAGVRLIDQDKNDPNRNSEDKYLPVYTGNTDTIKRSSIQNYLSALYGNTYVTQTNSNLLIGGPSDSYNEYIYGDIYIRPKLVLKEGVNVNENTGIKFEVITEQGSTAYNTSTLRPSDDQVNGADIYLPTKSSRIVGKLAGVTLLKNRLTKVSANDDNDYIDNSSIEEHMHHSVSTPNYVDIDVASVEFHAPIVDVNNVETRHITLGQKSNLNPDASNGGDFTEDGRLLEDELLSEIFAHPGQTTSHVTNYMPAESGVLVNNTDLNKLFKGQTNTLPVYGEPMTFPGESEPRTTLVDSKIEQVSSSLFESLFNTVSRIGQETRTLGEKANVSSDHYFDSRDADFVKEVYGDFEYDENHNKVYKNVGTPDNVNIKTDTIIGETAIGPNGRYISTPRSLMVTKSLVLGNSNTNSTHVVPGRTLFPHSNQYRYAKDESRIPEKDVYVEMPAVSGVLLTDNSRIDGGLYVN